jgi:hypothetical protein
MGKRRAEKDSSRMGGRERVDSRKRDLGRRQPRRQEIGHR